MSSLMRYWQASDVQTRCGTIGETWDLTKKALHEFEASGQGVEFAITYEDLVFSAGMLFSMLLDPEVMEEILADAVAFGDKSTRLLSDGDDPWLRANTHATTACFLYEYWDYASPTARATNRHILHWEKGLELSEEGALLAIVRSSPFMSAWYVTPPWLLDHNGGPSLLEAALKAALRTRDRLMIGNAYDLLAQDAGFRPHSIEDPDERASISKASLEYSREAKKQYSTISFISPRVGPNWVENPETYQLIALGLTESDRKKKLLMAHRESAKEMMIQAEVCGYPRALSIGNFHIVAGNVELAKLEGDASAKKQLLVEAIEHGEVVKRFYEDAFPFYVSMCGPSLAYLARARYDLSILEKDSEAKKRMLSESIESQRKAIDLTVEYGLPGSIASARYGQYYIALGDSLTRLHSLTKDPKHLREAVRAYNDSIEFFETTGMASLVAESHWKMAVTRDTLSEYRDASESFSFASRQYTLAAEHAPRLSQLFKDHASYMEGWSEIELAKDHHRKQEAVLSAQHFDRAAELHRSTKRWARMAPNYSAWACVEKAEDLSRKEENKESIEMFRRAGRLFEESRTSLMGEPASSDDPVEDRMIADLAAAARARKNYCDARAMVEEARVLEKKGDIASSYDRYGKAVTILEDLTKEVTADQDRREIMQVLNMTKAWQLMVKAEEESSPEMYGKAAELFEVAKEYSPVLNSKSLALGQGTRFADTGDLSLHEAATQHLESASKHYLKAGFTNIAEYATACRLLFDAYVYMGKAIKEESQEKRARLYAMAEKVLEASAISYDKAGQLAKKDQVLKLLGKVRADKALALSLTEVFRAPDMVTASAAFSGPTLTHEAATGLERFEHAIVQATLLARPGDLNVGEELSLDIELINAGRGSAQLTKVEEVIPRGFGVKVEPMSCRIEGSHLNMRGRRLDPLKTEDVKLVLTAKERGKFTICPRVMYLDESGKYKSFEPEPVEITVRELGISGWLKGADSRR